MVARKTKAQREERQRKALLQRITDVYSGALGEEWNEDTWAIAEQLALVIPALHSIFGAQIDRNWCWAPHSIKHFDHPKTATDFLFENGFRA